MDEYAPPVEPRTSGKALWSFVLGMASVLFFCFTAIPSVVLGIWGLADISARPAELKGSVLAVLGIVFSGLSMLMLPVLFVLLALLLPAVQAARDAARRSACTNNLKQIAVALYNYHDAHGSFPPPVTYDAAGQPMHSWRALLLPYLDPELAKQYDFDEPWNGPHNSKLAAQAPSFYHCPSDEGAQGDTDYALIVGPGALFADPGAAPKIRDCQDGASNTILVAETDGDRIPWLEPRDLDFATMPLQVDVEGSIGSPHRGGANIALADGSVHFLSHDADAPTIRALVTASGGEVLQTTPDGDYIVTGSGEKAN